MPLLVAVLLALLAAAAPAAAKPGHDRVALTWLSTPDGTPAGGVWEARFHVVPVGPVEPRVVVRDGVAGVEHHYLAAPEGEGVFTARVPFPEAGSFLVEAAGFDGLRPGRVADLGPPVVIEDAPVAEEGSRWWAWTGLAALVVLAAVLLARRLAPAAQLRRSL
jgi:hypothetical protein